MTERSDFTVISKGYNFVTGQTERMKKNLAQIAVELQGLNKRLPVLKSRSVQRRLTSIQDRVRS
jgi:hypothetical protein